MGNMSQQQSDEELHPNCGHDVIGLELLLLGQMHHPRMKTTSIKNPTTECGTMSHHFAGHKQNIHTPVHAWGGSFEPSNDEVPLGGEAINIGTSIGTHGCHVRPSQSSSTVHTPWSVNSKGVSVTVRQDCRSIASFMSETMQEEAAENTTVVSEEPAQGSTAATVRKTATTAGISKSNTILPSESKSDAKPVVWEVDVTDLVKPPKKQRPKSASGAVGKKPTSPRDSSKPKPKPVQPYIPPQNLATVETLHQRKVLDLKRWYCISRPQYQTSCGISSVVTCWNYLFSKLGYGSKHPITQEEALVILGFKPPFTDIKFGPFTGNCTLMRWFQQLNEHYKVRGRCYFVYKVHGRNTTFGVTSQDALQSLKKGLMGNSSAYIYHCQNHYFCPMGFEETPLKAEDAYRTDLAPLETDTWILIGDPSKRQPSIHCKRWEDISKDVNNQNPDYVDIRRLWLGQQKRKTKKSSGNLHCIMAFQRSQHQPVDFKETRPSTTKSRSGQKKRRPSSHLDSSRGDDPGLQDIEGDLENLDEDCYAYYM